MLFKKKDCFKNPSFVQTVRGRKTVWWVLDVSETTIALERFDFYTLLTILFAISFYD